MNDFVNDRPGKIVCVGRNYRDHAKELGNDVPREPLLFLKPPSSVVRDGEAIILPPASRQVEFEGEIGVVVGRTLRRADGHSFLVTLSRLPNGTTMAGFLDLGELERFEAMLAEDRDAFAPGRKSGDRQG